MFLLSVEKMEKINTLLYIYLQQKSQKKFLKSLVVATYVFLTNFIKRFKNCGDID